MSRALDWDGCLNVRDLGGIALEHGGETRAGALIRSDSLGHLTDAGWRAFAAHGVRRVVDLRWDEERADDRPRAIDVDLVHVSVLGDYDPTVDDGAEEFIPTRDVAGYRAQMYARWLENYGPNFGRALAAIADADGPVVFHCQGGKDRTGLVAALLLRIAGVSPAEIASDYAVSERAFLRGGEDVQSYFLLATPAEGMARLLDHLDSTYGGVVEYLRGGGLDDERIERLRTRLAPA